MARRKVKQVKSLEETASELRKTRQEMGYRKPQTISEKTKGKTTKSITLGAPGDTYGVAGMGQMLRKKRPTTEAKTMAAMGPKPRKKRAKKGS